MSDYIGIDFGTSYCRASIYRNGKVEIIPNEFGKRQTPSYLSINDEEIIFGKAAKNQLPFNLKNTFCNMITLFGKNKQKYSSHEKYLTFDVKEDPDALLFGENGKYNSEEIFYRIFEKIKQNAEQYLKKEVKNAIISVPIIFNYNQRKLLRKAADRVFHTNKFISATTASAFTFCLDMPLKEEKTILIFDLGGGFLDIAILKISEGLVETVSVFGNDDLGGRNFDERLVDYCAGEFKRKTNLDIYSNKKSLLRLLKVCENAKKILSYQDKVNIELDNLMEGEDLNIVITREKFEDICMDLFKKCTSHITKVINDSKISIPQIDEIILTGGSSRIPKIRQMIQELLDGKEINLSLNSEESVAIGAAIRGAIVSNCKDEKIEKLINLDITHFSYGIETVGGVMTVLIPKNSTFACKKTKIFSTYADNQTFAWIRLYEGERQLVKDNNLIESIRIDNITPLPRYQPFLEISIDINYDYIITLTAVDKTKEHPEILKQNVNMRNNNLFDLNNWNNFAIVIRDNFQAQNQNNMNMNYQNNMFGMNYPNAPNMNQFMPQMNNLQFPSMNFQNQNMFGMNYPNNPNFNSQFNQFNPQMNFQNNPNENININKNIEVKFNYIEEKTDKSQIIIIQSSLNMQLKELIEIFENKIGKINKKDIKYFLNNEKLNPDSNQTLGEKGIKENIIIIALEK